MGFPEAKQRWNREKCIQKIFIVHSKATEREREQGNARQQALAVDGQHVKEGNRTDEADSIATQVTAGAGDAQCPVKRRL